MPEKQITKKQHYIPQVYLEGFSPEGESIFEFHLESHRAIAQSVSIESVCREKYLYEVRDPSGEIINTNYLETVLCDYEGQFAEQRRQLLRKARIKENYKTRCFLTKEEKQFWIFYSTLHIMRNPVTLNGIKQIFQEELTESFSDTETRNIALAYCLPFFKKPEKGDLNALLGFISVLCTKGVSVGYAESDNLFTSDHAMYGFRNSKEEPFDFETLWFPISSDCGLIFFDSKETDHTQRNRLVPLSEEEVRELNKGIAYIASQMVLSKHPFSKADIQLIEEARSERAQDDERKKTHPVD